MAASMLRGAQPDTRAIRRCSPREKGSQRSRRALGGVGSTRDAILRARDWFPVAPVSVLETIPRPLLRVRLCQYHLVNLTMAVTGN
jgi:hypothetical protein